MITQTLIENKYEQIDNLALADLLKLQDFTFSIEETNPMNPWWGLMAEFEENPIINGEIPFQDHILKEAPEGKDRPAIILVPPVKAQGRGPYSYPLFCRPHLTLWKLWGYYPEVVGFKTNLVSFEEMRGALSSRSYIDFKFL